MANKTQYKKSVKSEMFRHYERAKKANGEYYQFENELIDASRSYLNYNLAKDLQPLGQEEYFKKRTSEVFYRPRKDLNMLASWLVTLPKDVKPEDTKAFFEATFEFLCERYGEKNVISAYVHMDETRPHVHFAFIPVVYDKKKERYKISDHDLFTRMEMKNFHPALSKAVETALGYSCEIMNGATSGGNKTVLELKAQTLKAEVTNLESKIEQSRDELKSLDDEIVATAKQPKKNSLFRKNDDELTSISVSKLEMLSKRANAYDEIEKSKAAAEKLALETQKQIETELRLHQANQENAEKVRKNTNKLKEGQRELKEKMENFDKEVERRAQERAIQITDEKLRKAEKSVKNKAEVIEIMQDFIAGKGLEDEFEIYYKEVIGRDGRNG